MKFGILLAAAALASPVNAQDVAAPLTIAIPPLPTPRNDKTDAGETAAIGAQIAELIASDLRSTGRFLPLVGDLTPPYSFPEATAPAFRKWRVTGARAMVSGYVELRSDGRLTIACYLHDVTTGRERARQGFVVAVSEWRRAGHRCADTVYKGVTNHDGHFDTRIAYVAESGSADAPVKRLAVMDWDGSNHAFLTPGHATVVRPRFSPDGQRLLYTSFLEGFSQLRLLDLANGADRPLNPGPQMSFAGSFSPDGRRIVFSVASEGNTDIFIADAEGGPAQRLTSAPGTDTSPTFSPDGSRIVFESDRSGVGQLYVMSADGSGQRRISFGGGRYSAPAWSPDGERIAFTKISDNWLRVGIMTPDGGEERVLSDGWQDEAPGWAPNGQRLMFQRTDPATGRAVLHSVPLTGGRGTAVTTPQSGSDPSWSPLRS